MIKISNLEKYSNVTTPGKIKKEFKKLSIEKKSFSNAFPLYSVKFVTSNKFFNGMLFDGKISIPSKDYITYEKGDHNLYNIGFEFTGYVITCKKFTLYVKLEDFESCMELISYILGRFEKTDKMFVFPESLAFFNSVEKLTDFIKNYNFKSSFSIFLNNSNPRYAAFNNMYFNSDEQKYIGV